MSGRKEQSHGTVFNAKLGHGAVHKRKRGATGSRAETAPEAAARLEYTPIASDEMGFSTAADEPVFMYTEWGRSQRDGDGLMEVLPTLNGLAPHDVWTHVKYMGVAVAQTNYAPDKAIAIKQSGKARLLNTGTATIRAGEWWELYAMSAREVSDYKKKYSTKRVLAGTRAWAASRSDLHEILTQPNRNLSADERTAQTAIVAALGRNSIRDILTEVAKYKAEQSSRIVGMALHTAQPGQYAEVLLSLRAPS
jgi:hypothetical protein